jgi:hypothetical protein
LSQRPSFLIAEADVPALREVMSRLVAVGYNERQIRERLGLEDLNDLLWRALPIYRVERLVDRDALASAIDLFLLQGVVPRDALGRIFGNSGWEVLVRTGLLEIGGDGMARACASLFPAGRQLLFSDHAWPMLPHPGWKTVPRDQVMFVGTDSRWLARATVRRRVEAALDLCTGSGVHALLAATHARRAVAVDVSERAVSCTRFNALASGLGDVEAVVGDLFEPVRGQRFDLITANPPFVPSPLNSLGYRDGGTSGEEVQKRIVAGLPEHLAPGGVAQMVTELGVREGEPLSERVRGWLEGASMDIQILSLREFSAASYAIGHAQSDDDYGTFLCSVDEWARNLRSQGYSRVVSVLIAFQWSDPILGPSWSCMRQAQPPIRNAGSEIEALLLAERTARQPNLEAVLEQSRLVRSGPIGFVETRMLGGNLDGDMRAKLLGKAMPIDYRPDRIEREILVAAEKPLAWKELLGLASNLGTYPEQALASLRSLLASGLVRLARGD